MVNKTQIGDCTLYLASSIDVMPDLEPVSCVVSDPPYLLTAGGNTTGEMGGKFSRGKYDNSGAIVETEIDWPDFMPLIYNSIDRGHAYIMANNRNVRAAIDAGEKAGFGFHNLLVWNKGTATPNRWYMKNCEFTVLFYKGKAKYINDCGSKQLLNCPNVLDSEHPTQKPIALMEHYIRNSTNPNETVLDPFMGSGTTGVACVKLGRKFIGIELDQKYFDIACKRIEDAYKQPEMFIEPFTKPTQQTIDL
jgi:DNA modification methylase